jgi:peptidoglycan/xylan/chitin deacetylase (PgdA/CDA1 family)
MRVFKNSFLLIILFTTSSLSQEIMDFEKSLSPSCLTYLKNIPSEDKDYFIFNFKTEKKQLVITFDDGPNFNTKKIISLKDALKN